MTKEFHQLVKHCAQILNNNNNVINTHKIQTQIAIMNITWAKNYFNINILWQLMKNSTKQFIKKIKSHK